MFGRFAFLRQKINKEERSKVEIMTTNEMWERLEELGVSEQTLQIVTDINGYNNETMLDILYAHTGYRNFDQLDN